ncbi:MAG: hypothetical protein IJ343_10795 [Clostridia bacterium]|nr:hypothetical protein [Clostridia bacterium]
MLTALYQVLCQRLSEAGFTVFAEDCVPGDAAFPFVTLRIDASAPLQDGGAVILTGWLRSNAPHRDRLAMADALLRLVPGAGLKLPLAGGLALLHQGGRPCVQWLQSGGALGAQVRHSLRLCGLFEAEVSR